MNDENKSKFKVPENWEEELGKIKNQASDMIEKVVGELTQRVRDFRGHHGDGEPNVGKIAADLEKFAELKEKGVLDDKEFNEIKKKLLAKL